MDQIANSSTPAATQELQVTGFGQALANALIIIPIIGNLLLIILLKRQHKSINPTPKQWLTIIIVGTLIFWTFETLQSWFGIYFPCYRSATPYTFDCLVNHLLKGIALPALWLNFSILLSRLLTKPKTHS